MYTSERNIQILISLLKGFGIKKVIASPGATNYTFVGSLQNDPFFEIYSCVDERSAAYLAVGMCDECGEPIVLSCTGATASRNYMSGLTEAYYRKLPILAITSMEPRTGVGQLRAQQIDRSQLPKDIAVESVYLSPVNNEEDAYNAMLLINKALLSLNHRGGGPVHIDVASTFGKITKMELPECRRINRIVQGQEFPKLPKGKIALMVGAHKPFSHELTSVIDAFCSSCNAIVLCVNPSSFCGEYAFHPGLLFSQLGCERELKNFDLIIHIGEVSSDYVGFGFNAKEVWRVSEDGCIKDRYRTLTNVFELPEKIFFEHYIEKDINQRTLLDRYIYEDNLIRKKMPELPFSNCWIAQQFALTIEPADEIYLGIVNSLRVWDYTKLPKSTKTHANTGGFGIDGCLSTMIGASIINPNKDYYGVFGDLAFFYDCNVLGNRHIGNNLHIIVINNDGGQQFRNFDHPASSLGQQTNNFVAAAGHYGPQSRDLIKHFSQDLGFRYVTASNKDEFEQIIPEFRKRGSSVVLEVFVSESDENSALTKIRNIIPQKEDLTSKIKEVIAEKIPPHKISAIKTLLGK